MKDKDVLFDLIDEIFEYEIDQYEVKHHNSIKPVFSKLKARLKRKLRDKFLKK